VQKTQPLFVALLLVLILNESLQSFDLGGSHFDFGVESVSLDVRIWFFVKLEQFENMPDLAKGECVFNQ
jgi:hypothetical protein